MRLEAMMMGVGLALAGCTGAPEAPRSSPSGVERPPVPVLSRAPEGPIDVAELRPAGPARRCLPLRDVQQTRPGGTTHLMLLTGNQRWFRAEAIAGCPSQRPDRAIIFRQSTGMICEGDLYEVQDFQSGINFGQCRLGMFEPVNLPRGADF